MSKLQKLLSMLGYLRKTQDENQLSLHRKIIDQNQHNSKYRCLVNTTTRLS